MTRPVLPRYPNNSPACTGCPSLTIRESADPLRAEPVTAIDETCVGCGLCGELAHAAALCPSFSRVETVVNPGALERGLFRLRRLVTGRAAA